MKRKVLEEQYYMHRRSAQCEYTLLAFSGIDAYSCLRLAICATFRSKNSLSGSLYSPSPTEGQTSEVSVSVDLVRPSPWTDRQSAGYENLYGVKHRDISS